MTKKSKESAPIDGKLIETIAKAIHEANRVLNKHYGNETIAHWDEATNEERAITLEQVEGCIKDDADLLIKGDPNEQGEKEVALFNGIMNALK